MKYDTYKLYWQMDELPIYQIFFLKSTQQSLSDPFR